MKRTLADIDVDGLVDALAAPEVTAALGAFWRSVKTAGPPAMQDLLDVLSAVRDLVTKLLPVLPAQYGAIAMLALVVLGIVERRLREHLTLNTVEGESDDG